MSEDLMITQQDLIDWIDRPPSNDDLDLALFISTRLEKFYELEQKLQQKENIIKEVRELVQRYNILIGYYDGYECYDGMYDTYSHDTVKEELLKILKGEDKE